MLPRLVRTISPIDSPSLSFNAPRSQQVGSPCRLLKAAVARPAVDLGIALPRATTAGRWAAFVPKASATLASSPPTLDGRRLPPGGGVITCAVTRTATRVSDRAAPQSPVSMFALHGKSKRVEHAVERADVHLAVRAPETPAPEGGRDRTPTGPEFLAVRTVQRVEHRR